MRHLLEREQWLPVTLADAWAFFSDPRNLDRITPPKMGLVIRPPFDDRPMYPGQRIIYSLKPLFGVPLKWVSVIAEVEERRRFMDIQVKGPYKRWWHEHLFIEGGGGVWIRDRVEYELPLGPFGRIAHWAFVKTYLERIFDFRRHTLERSFPAGAEKPHP